MSLFRLGVLCLLGVVVVAPGLSTAGCSEEPGKTCVGGVVVNGACQPKCDPAKCLDGNVCVTNALGSQCKLACVSHKDCSWPAQATSSRTHSSGCAPVSSKQPPSGSHSSPFGQANALHSLPFGQGTP